MFQDTMFQAGCGTRIWGQTRCPIYRSGTFNVKRSTLNFQRGDRKGARWAGYGDRHGAWATGLLTAGPGGAPGGRSRPAAAPGYGDRHGVRTDQERLTSNVQLSTFNGVTEMANGGRNMGTDTMFQAGCGTLIWGQTRCPICRSRTFNVKRSTLNFQRGDRKGARWAGYGDRHGVWASGSFGFG